MLACALQLLKPPLKLLVFGLKLADFFQVLCIVSFKMFCCLKHLRRLDLVSL